MSTNRKPPARNRGPNREQESIGKPACHCESSTVPPNRQAGEGVPLRLPSGKIGGYLFGNLLRKTIQGSKHILWKVPGIASDIQLLDLAQRKGVRRIEVVDEESDVIYEALLSDFWEFGKEINLGCGRQRVLPLSRWRKTVPDAPGQLAFNFGG